MMLKLKLPILVFFFLGIQDFSSQNVGFAWGKQIKGFTKGVAMDVQLDTAGNIYVAGRFMNTFDFDPGPGVYTLTTLGYAPFVAKYDSIGNLVWAKHFNNPFYISTQSWCSSICVDNIGNVYSTGSFQDFLDFDPGPGTFTMNPTLGQMYVCKLSSAGNFIWAVQMGKDSSGIGLSMHPDGAGNLVVVGNFKGSNNDFDPGPGVYNLSAQGNSDAFICKLSSAGSFIWANRIGSPGFVNAFSLDVDNSGNIITTGNFSLTADFDPGSGTYTMNAQNGAIYVNVLNSNGTFLLSWQIAGVVGVANHVTIDNSGNIILCGSFGGTSDFDPGPGVFAMSATGSTDAFLCKCTLNGLLLWAKQLGGPTWESAYCVQVDPVGGVYICGSFAGIIDLDPGVGSFTLVSPAPFGDSYLAKLDVNGNFVWAKHLTGPGSENVTSIKVDPQFNLYATGYAQNGTDLDPGPGTYSLSVMDIDPYILKLSPCVSPPSPTINSAALTSCGPAVFSMSASPTNSISWRTQLMSNTYISTLAVLNTSTLPVGNYSFYAASSNTCAESFPPALAQVSVFPIPTIGIVSSKDIFCLGEPVTLTASGGMNYVMGSTFSSGTFTVWPTPGATYTITGGDANNCYNTATISLQYDLCTDLKENSSNKNGLQIWPNPGSGEFHVKGQAMNKIEIYNNASQLFYFENFKNSPAGPREEISIHPNLAPGIYYLKVFAEGEEVFVRKLVLVD